MNTTTEYTSIEKRVLRLGKEVMENYSDMEFHLIDDDNALIHIGITVNHGQLVFDHAFECNSRIKCDEDVIPAIGYYIGKLLIDGMVHRNWKEYQKDYIRMLNELRFKFYDQECVLYGAKYPLAKMDMFCD